MLQRYLDGQRRRPTGLLGRWIGQQMAQQHQPENRWTLQWLDLRPTDRILEIGFGPGFAIQEAAKVAGFVAGIDFSKTMVSAASKRNANAIRNGKVEIQYGDAARLPFEDRTFDKAFSIHSIYFWPDPVAALREMGRVLKPGGIAILTILPKERWNEENPDAPVGTSECTPYFGEELRDFLAQAGFATTRIEADEDGRYRSNYSVIAQK
jgi:ubiquinone/menaquinone biosynthesis C-methylase UbiE